MAFLRFPSQAFYRFFLSASSCKKQIIQSVIAEQLDKIPMFYDGRFLSLFPQNTEIM